MLPIAQATVGLVDWNPTKKSTSLTAMLQKFHFNDRLLFPVK
jgi:hypothetical protein